MKIGIGHSEAVDSLDAIQEVLESCENQLEGAKPDAAILFSAICYDYSTILEKINDRFPGIQIIGCTTDGELSSVNSFLEDSVVLTCISSEKVKFSGGSGTGLSSNYDQAVKDALKEAKEKLVGEPKLCITYYDSLTASGTAVLESLQKQLGDDVFVFGGAAGDQWEMKATYQFHNGDVLNDSVTIFLVGGDLNVSAGVATGRETFGQVFTITKSENNVVHEIDNQPANDFYQKYVGESTKATTDNPLAVLLDDGENFYLRSPFVFNEEGSVVFAADIPEGSKVKLTRSTQETILKAVEKASNAALDNFEGDKIDLALISSCAGRRILLGAKVEEEIQILKNLLPEKVGIGGFYAYGEIGPVNKNSKSNFHNETFITLLLGEK